MRVTRRPPPLFSISSARVLPFAKPSSSTNRCAENTRGEVSDKSVLRTGSKRGAINHKYSIPIPAAMAVGMKKSNICRRRIPMSAATDTTSRLVEVPMVVLMPPTSVAKPIGINIPEADVFVRNETLIRIGSNSTTIGTLFTKALSIAPTISVNSSESCGLIRHRRARPRPTGSRAPVRTSPCPAIMSAVTATRASWPKPRKKSTACRVSPCALV